MKKGDRIKKRVEGLITHLVKLDRIKQLLEELFSDCYPTPEKPLGKDRKRKKRI